ncbi:MAG: hypothetical protein ABSG90_12815 [Dehalococcoidia bacterium]|jgi:hypothetical protein
MDEQGRKELTEFLSEPIPHGGFTQKDETKIWRTFTTADDMMAVKGKLVKEGMWDDFLDYSFFGKKTGMYGENGYRKTTGDPSAFIDVVGKWLNWLINPTRFCELALQFGKEVFGWK